MGFFRKMLCLDKDKEFETYSGPFDEESRATKEAADAEWARKMIDEQINDPEEAARIQKKLAEAPKWIEITGYKATRADGHSFSGDIIYKVGETYQCSDVIPCQQGYHFSRTFKRVLEMYPPQYGTRYFRVKALVPAHAFLDAKEELHLRPKSCEELLHRDWTHTWGAPLSLKYASKRMTILEEVPFEEYKDSIPALFAENEEVYRTLLTDDDYRQFVLNKWKSEASRVFSEPLIMAAFSEYTEKMDRDHRPVESLPKAYERLKKALATVEKENITQDMKVFIFLKMLTLI